MSGFMKLETTRSIAHEDCFMPDWMMNVMMEDSQWLDTYQRNAMKKSAGFSAEQKIQVLDEDKSCASNMESVGAESGIKASQELEAFALPAGEFANWSKMQSNVKAETSRLLTEAKVISPSRAHNQQGHLRIENEGVDGRMDQE